MSFRAGVCDGLSPIHWFVGSRELRQRVSSPRLGQVSAVMPTARSGGQAEARKMWFDPVHELARTLLIASSSRARLATETSILFLLQCPARKHVHRHVEGTKYGR